VFAAKAKKKIAEQFNLEFRVCDGAASPYMAFLAHHAASYCA
jgi:glutamine synthetase